MGSVDDVAGARDRSSDRRRHREVLRHLPRLQKILSAACDSDQRSSDAGTDHLGYDRYVVDTGRCFPYFAKYSYCSICLPVCVYNHKEWARDFESGAPTKLFPTVLMPEPPSPTDLPASHACHTYPRIDRP
jgi:hypothetical protein